MEPSKAGVEKAPAGTSETAGAATFVKVNFRNAILLQTRPLPPASSAGEVGKAPGAGRRCAAGFPEAATIAAWPVPAALAAVGGADSL